MNYHRWQPFDINNTIPIYFHLYADGFRTWMSRSGHVVGIYMSLSQLPIDQLNYAENIKLVALVPAGIKTMDVFRVISEDIYCKCNVVLFLCGIMGASCWYSQY